MMPTNLRKLGVEGKNKPTKKSKVVRASAFNIGGLIGQFERKYKKVFVTKSPEEEREIFGDHINSAFYGKDETNLFWNNMKGQDAELYIKSHVGYNGTTFDAVNATATVNDQTNPAFKGESAYKTELDYGISGNRTGYTISNGNRFSTTLATAVVGAETQLNVVSVIGVVVGDIIKLTLDASTEYHKITEIDETAKLLKFATAVGGAGAIGKAVDVLGFKIKTYRKSLSGIVTEVETALGNRWLSPESEVTEYFIDNVMSQNKWTKWSKVTSASTLDSRFPTDVTTVTYLTGGLDGTSPTTPGHWSADLTAFNSLPVRALCNAEAVAEDVNKAGEVYCNGRSDTPYWIANIAEDQTKSQLLDIGSAYQRSDDVFQVNVAGWLNITDPFNTSPNAPDRAVPNVGAVMSAWLYTIATLGIHYIPAVSEVTLVGINSIADTNLGDNVSDQDRTDLAEYGINLIQFVDGGGFRIRNFFTPSTSEDGRFANGGLMRNYIKISSEDSLNDTENSPNSFNRIRSSKSAIDKFMYRLWVRGSTGNVPEGETFAISENADGSLTGPDDHYEVQGDIINNPVEDVQAGERNFDVAFTFPSPAGSIRINVGIILR
jgi:hypothetical protein